MNKEMLIKKLKNNIKKEIEEEKQQAREERVDFMKYLKYVIEECLERGGTSTLFEARSENDFRYKIVEKFFKKIELWQNHHEIEKSYRFYLTVEELEIFCRAYKQNIEMLNL